MTSCLGKFEGGRKNFKSRVELGMWRIMETGRWVVQEKDGVENTRNTERRGFTLTLDMEAEVWAWNLELWGSAGHC